MDARKCGPLLLNEAHDKRRATRFVALTASLDTTRRSAQLRTETHSRSNRCNRSRQDERPRHQAAVAQDIRKAQDEAGQQGKRIHPYHETTAPLLLTLRFAGLLRLRPEEPDLDLSALWHLSVSRLFGQPPQPRCAHFLCAVY